MSRPAASREPTRRARWELRPAVRPGRTAPDSAPPDISRQKLQYEVEEVVTDQTLIPILDQRIAEIDKCRANGCYLARSLLRSGTNPRRKPRTPDPLKRRTGYPRLDRGDAVVTSSLGHMVWKFLKDWIRRRADRGRGVGPPWSSTHDREQVADLL